ncbi:MAG TPA: hypothetical protein VIV06_00870 [Candidatus Limnocylindrales bacterium]
MPPRLLLVTRHGAADALIAHLSRHGFEICGVVTTPTGAAEAARLGRPDVVLIDAAVRAGWEAVASALDGLVARGHVAVLAAYWSGEARQNAAALGIGATLLKRVGGPELIDRLRSLAAPA